MIAEKHLCRTCVRCVIIPLEIDYKRVSVVCSQNNKEFHPQMPVECKYYKGR